MSESAILKRIMLACSNGATRLMRNSSGAYKDPSGRFIRYGLPSSGGGADLVGWTSIVVTPEMVNKKVCIFTAIEVKSDKGKLRPEQKIFLDAVHDAGGISIEARSEQEAMDGIRTYKPK